jgi:hypothetical protein
VIVALGSGRRVRVGVQVMKIRVGVLDGVIVSVAVGTLVSEGVRVGVRVSVGMKAVISPTVSAAAVLIGLENAESTISCGSMAETSDVPGFASAAAATMQNRLNPNAPAPKTVKGPEYSLIFTLFSPPSSIAPYGNFDLHGSNSLSCKPSRFVRDDRCACVRIKMHYNVTDFLTASSGMRHV